MIGQLVLHYRIQEELGRGGMGVVYKAEDTRLNRTVALKFLPRGLEHHEPERARFLREAQAAATLNHPNICTVHDIQECEGQQFIVMEYIDGRTLSDLVPFTKWQDAIIYGLQICEALEEAHSKGIVHRDIKTQNIMVTKNQAKVMDFGLAKLKGSLKLTKTSSTVGTLAYMAPEHLQGAEVDARSDIFSFGVVLYEMLTGHLPFRGEHEAALMYSVLNDEPESLQRYVPDAPSELLHVISRALEKDPDERYQTVHEVVIDLRRVKKQTSRIFRPPVPPPPAGEGAGTVEQPSSTAVTRGKRRRVFIIAGVAGACVFAMAVASYFALRSHAPSLNPKMSFRTLDLPFAQIGALCLSRDGNWMAFSARSTEGEWSIHFMNIARQNTQRLLTEPFRNIYNAEISPDGSEILFDGYSSDPRDIEVLAVSSLGGTPRKIARPGFSPRWHPDGQRIGYLREGIPDIPGGVGKVEFWTVGADGRDNRLEFADTVSYAWGWYKFDWSPNGKSIAWLRVLPDQTNEIIVRDLQSGKERQLTHERKDIADLAWASNDQLFFSSLRSGSTNIWMVPASGGEAVQITKGSGPDVAVRPSGDARRLLYLEKRELGQLWSARIDGSGVRQLTFDDQRPGMPAMSPDGKKISFMMGANDPLRKFLHVYTMDSDGGNRVQLMPGDALEYTATWSPDGRYLAYGSFRQDEVVDSTHVYLLEVSNPATPRRVGRGWWAFWVGAEKLVVIPWQPSLFSTLYSVRSENPIEVSEDSTWRFPLRDSTVILVLDMRKGREGWWQKGAGRDTAFRQVLSGEHLYTSWPSASFNYLIYRQANGQVWRVSIPGGKRERLPDILNGINPYFGQLAFSFDDRQVLFVKRRLQARGVLVENVFE